jgi:hypothetical protein
VRRISAADAAKLAALRAEVAELELARLQVETAQRNAQARRQNTIIAIAASAVIALILVTGVAYVATVPTVARAPVTAQPGAGPDDRFSETRAGVVRFAEGEGRRCRQVDFNNTSGRFSNEALVACYDPRTEDINHQTPRGQAGDAFEGIRNSFRR